MMMMGARGVGVMVVTAGRAGHARRVERVHGVDWLKVSVGIPVSGVDQGCEVGLSVMPAAASALIPATYERNGFRRSVEIYD